MTRAAAEIEVERFRDGFLVREDHRFERAQALHADLVTRPRIERERRALALECRLDSDVCDYTIRLWTRFRQKK